MRSVFHHKGKVQTLQSDDWLNVTKAEGFAAVIFDCDGTLVESSDAHMHCMQVAAMDQGFEMRRDWYLTRTGLDRQSLFQAFADHVDAPFDVRRARDRSIALFGKFAVLVRPLEETIGLAKSLWRKNLPLAVVTNAEREVAERSLTQVGIQHLFEPLVSVSDGVRPKPAPDMFLLAAKALGVAPGKTLVLEDSPQGVSAALAAGMSAVHLEHAPQFVAPSQAKDGG